MQTLNVVYSATCNKQFCKYCLERFDDDMNVPIRRTIINGQYQAAIIPVFNRKNCSILGIRGIEPTINQDLWNEFIIPILDGCPTLQKIQIYTNGIQFHYHDWIDCLLDYCHQYNKYLQIDVIVGIDGPNCKNFGEHTLLDICKTYTTDQYLTINISTLSIFEQQDIYQNIQQWYEYMGAIKHLCSQYAPNGCNIEGIGCPPVLSHRMMIWTKEDGEQWAKWNSPRLAYCPAGRDEWTIDWEGHVYDCWYKQNYSPYIHNISLEQFAQTCKTLIEENLIPNQDITVLYSKMKPGLCWAQPNLYNEIIAWGNGAQKE